MTYLGIRVTNWLGLAVVSLALGLGLAHTGALPEPECELLYVEPSGPEPSVTVWHSHWDCAGEPLMLEYVPAADLLWDCGAVWEDGQWVEASCSTEEELESRMGSLRAERQSERSWSE